jgi:hypothetical protein
MAGRRAKPAIEEPDMWDVIVDDIHAGDFGFYTWKVQTGWRLPRGNLWDSILIGKTRLFGDVQEWNVEDYTFLLPWRVWE